MSRVDEERDAARAAARLAEAKRTEEAQKSKKAAENNAFSKLVQGQKQQAAQTQKQQVGKNAIAQLLESAESDRMLEHGSTERLDQGRQGDRAFSGRVGQQGKEQLAAGRAKTEGRQAMESKLASDQGTAEGAQGRAGDQAGQSRAAAGRGVDARAGRERLEAKGEKGSEGGEGAAVQGARGDKELKTDADRGGQGQGQGGKGEDKGGGAANPGFRFNPALMAPVPVAKAKDTSGSERLRKVANELAQKIVERVRVGTNALGRAEFQIDLRGDVLKGLSVKVSAHNGKISAVFQGNDKDVLKLLEEHRDSLSQALGSRGLTLEELKIEERG